MHDEATTPPAAPTWDLKDWPGDKIPIVFKKQPVEYQVAKTPDQLAEWEGLLSNRVRLSSGAEFDAGYLPTLSYCGPNETNCCDSDTIPTALEA
jgi:hypothetical protein